MDSDDLHFGQQHVETTHLFPDPYHTVPIDSIPHYQFLEGNRQDYQTYLKNSWDYHDIPNTPDKRKSKIEEFDDLLKDIDDNGFQKPIKYVVRPDGRKIIFDGNHRASIAHYLNIPLPAVEIPVERFFSQECASLR